jgi:hypothetical protein
MLRGDYWMADIQRPTYTRAITFAPTPDEPAFVDFTKSKVVAVTFVML